MIPPRARTSFFGYIDREIPDSREGMPNIKSAKKRMELSRVARSRNRAKRSRLRLAVKRVRQAESAETAQASLREALVLLDRAATKRLLHPNKAARLKSKLTRHVQSLSS